MKKSLLKVSFISILAIIISGSAFGVSGTVLGPGGGGGAGGGPGAAGVAGDVAGGGDVGGLCQGVEISIQSGYYFPTLDTGSGTKCLAGYYCPSGHFWADCSERPDGTLLCSGTYFDNRCGILSPEVSNFNLNKCPDGTTSDEGADSIDDCYSIESPTPSRVPRRIAKDETNPECDDTTLGTASGSTDFEADWTANTINITWVNDGAQVGTSTCTYDQSFTLPTTPTKTGYNFAGWKVVSQ